MTKRIDEGKRLSQAVMYGTTVYLAGQVAGDVTADVAGQTAQILEKIDRLLAAANSDRSRLLSVSIWLADIAFFDAMNAVWDAWIAGVGSPARACVEARLAGPELKVEIASVAACDPEAADLT
jgi:enamine deaminase RidA (YjgF/YER057c/UK114 family)